jgi:ribosomal protein S18 acetylase RimI-like enzyme
VRGEVKDSTTYVIEVHGRSAGRLRVVRTAEQIEIVGIQMLPDDQRCGVGTAVITALLQEGTQHCVPVVLEVEKDNPDAKRLILHLGFEPQGETRDTFCMTAFPPDGQGPRA